MMIKYISESGLVSLIKELSVRFKAMFFSKNESEEIEISEVEIAESAFVDSTPTSGSSNLVTSGGVASALGSKANSSDVYNKAQIDEMIGGIDSVLTRILGEE